MEIYINYSDDQTENLLNIKTSEYYLKIYSTAQKDFLQILQNHPKNKFEMEKSFIEIITLNGAFLTTKLKNFESLLTVDIYSIKHCSINKTYNNDKEIGSGKTTILTNYSNNFIRDNLNYDEIPTNSNECIRKILLLITLLYA